MTHTVGPRAAAAGLQQSVAHQCKTLNLSPVGPMEGYDVGKTVDERGGSGRSGASVRTPDWEAEMEEELSRALRAITTTPPHEEEDLIVGSPSPLPSWDDVKDVGVQGEHMCETEKSVRTAEEVPQEPREEGGPSEKGSSPHLEAATVSSVSSPAETSLAFTARVQTFRNALQTEKLDVSVVRSLAFQGIPESLGLRRTYWQILLGYLPSDTLAWDKEREAKRSLYMQWKKDLIVDPHSGLVEEDDHPLNTDHSSKWHEFFADGEIMEEIDKDVQRTLPDLHFFCGGCDQPNTMSEHYHALRRILFIFAKLNPGIKYIQGMNELLAHLYYVFMTDGPPGYRPAVEDVEADSFFCFTNLMAEIRDRFCAELDKSVEGIHAAMMEVNEMVRTTDYQLWMNLEEKKINPQFYSFRWLTLLLSQEFDLPDTLRLWDSLFGDADRFQFLNYMCCAMIMHLREEIMQNDFGDTLKMLQHYPFTDIRILIHKAMQLQSRDHGALEGTIPKRRTQDTVLQRMSQKLVEGSIPPPSPGVLGEKKSKRSPVTERASTNSFRPIPLTSFSSSPSSSSPSPPPLPPRLLRSSRNGDCKGGNERRSSSSSS